MLQELQQAQNDILKENDLSIFERIFKILETNFDAQKTITKDQRILLGEVVLRSIRGETISCQELQQILGETERTVPEIIAMLNKQLATHHLAPVKIVGFKTPGKREKSYIALKTEDPKISQETENQSTTSDIIAEIRLAIQKLKNIEIAEDENEFDIEPSELAKIQEAMGKFLKYSQDILEGRGTKQPSEQSKRLLNILIEATRRGKAISSKEIAKLMDIPPEEATLRVKILRQTLKRSHVFRLEMGTQISKNNRRIFGHYIKFKTSEKKETDTTAIQKLSPDEKRETIQRLTAATGNFQKRSGPYFIIEGLLRACKTNSSTTLEKCRKIQKETDEENFSLRRYKEGLIELRKTSEEQFGFKILVEGNKIQAVATGEIQHMGNSEIAQEKKAENLAYEELERRIIDGSRHIITKTNSEGPEKCLRYLLKQLREGKWSFAAEIGAAAGVQDRQAQKWIARIVRINEEYPTILGFTVVTEKGKYKLQMTEPYRRALVEYTGRTSPYPVCIEDNNFSNSIFEEEIANVENKHDDSITVRAVRKLAEFTGNGVAISIPYLMRTIGVEDYPASIISTLKKWCEYHLLTSRIENYKDGTIKMTSENVDDKIKRELEPLNKIAKRIQNRLQRIEVIGVKVESTATEIRRLVNAISRNNKHLLDRIESVILDGEAKSSGNLEEASNRLRLTMAVEKQTETNCVTEEGWYTYEGKKSGNEGSEHFPGLVGECFQIIDIERSSEEYKIKANALGVTTSYALIILGGNINRISKIPRRFCKTIPNPF